MRAHGEGGDVEPEPGALGVSDSARVLTNHRLPVVLLVDDDEYVRHAVRGILRRMSVRVVEASTAAEAIAHCGSENPALALVDLGLPDADGLELVADLRASGGDRLGIVVLTGQVPDEADVRAAGADALVLKPYRLDELRAVVQSHLPARGARLPEERPGP